MKICILGSSVGLRIRPPRKDAGERTYAEWLESQGHNVRNVSPAGAMINEAYACFDDDVLSFFPHLVIVHHGVNEACLRRTFRWSTFGVARNYFNNRIHGRSYRFAGFWTTLRYGLLRVWNGMVRRLAQVLGRNWQWLSTPRFIAVVSAMIDMVHKETSAAVIVIGVTPCSERVRRILPGSSESIHVMNLELKALVQRYPRRVRFLNVEEELGRESLTDLAPDGVHFSARGHAWIHGLLDRTIEELRQSGELPPEDCAAPSR